MQAGRETAGPERRCAARCRPPRSSAWLRDNTESSNEVGLDLREFLPLPRNILHSPRVASRILYGVANESNGKRLARGLSRLALTNPPISTDNLSYPVGVRDTTKSGSGLPITTSYLISFKSLPTNVGGSYQNAKESSPLMSGMSVGGVIVCAWQRVSQAG